MLLTVSLIAQSTRREQTLEGFLWLAAVVLVGTALLAIIAYVKRRRDAVSGRHAPPFTLDELRRMRDAGKLSPEEYETLKRRLLCGTDN